MAYELYPAVDETYNFPPEVRAKLAVSPELRNTVIPMTESARNNLTGAALWDGRLILNTTSDRVNRYDQGSGTWAVLVEQTDISTGISNATPVGAIIAFAGSAAPIGWHLCNGTTHSSAALTTVLTLGGHANPDKTPNLTDKFILGDGGSKPTSGGFDRVTLSALETGIRAHTHPQGTVVAETQEHTHPVNPPNTATSGHTINHSHYVSVGGGDHNHLVYGSQATMDMDAAGSGYDVPVKTMEYLSGGGHGHAAQSGDANVDHAHYVDIPQFDSLGRSASHTHVFNTPSNADGPAAESHENMPPYYALTYIIKTT